MCWGSVSGHSWRCWKEQEAVVEVVGRGGGVRTSIDRRTGPRSFCVYLASRNRRRKTDSRIEVISIVLGRGRGRKSGKPTGSE